MSLGDILYTPGISFKNPKLVKRAAPVRVRPWFYQETGVGPLSAVNKLKPLAESKVLNRRRAVWNRDIKVENAEKLGAYFHQVPSAEQLGLGEAPATGTTENVNRDPLGFLTNAINQISSAGTSVLTAMQRREDQKAQSAMATVQAYKNQMMANVSGSNMPLILGGVAAAGLAAWFLLKK